MRIWEYRVVSHLAWASRVDAELLFRRIASDVHREHGLCGLTAA